MIVYKSKVSHSIGKWLLAVTIFILTMTITWDEVEGSPLGASVTLDKVIAVSTPIVK